MNNIAVRGTTAPVECKKRQPIFRRSSGDSLGALGSNTTRPTRSRNLPDDTAEGVGAEQIPVRSRSGRRGIRLFATCLMVAVASLGTLSFSDAPASAAVTVPSASCRDGAVNTLVGVAADRQVVNGGQWVSVRYFLTNIYGGTYDSGYQSHFFAPRWGTQYDVRNFYMRHHYGWHDTTRVWANVRYWDGARWIYNQKWDELGVCKLSFIN